MCKVDSFLAKCQFVLFHGFCSIFCGIEYDPSNTTLKFKGNTKLQAQEGHICIHNTEGICSFTCMIEAKLEGLSKITR